VSRTHKHKPIEYLGMPMEKSRSRSYVIAHAAWWRREGNKHFSREPGDFADMRIHSPKWKPIFFRAYSKKNAAREIREQLGE
jgi:hypothetical protein